MELKKVYFVTGIDTDAGKTVVTGALARHMRSEGHNVITQKFIQTGCRGISEDIEAHRRIMGIGLQREDIDGTTCPIVFTYPASPHLAAAIDGREIDLTAATSSTEKLLEKYDTVLIEGAGGVHVPLEGFGGAGSTGGKRTTIDYMAEHSLPAIVVTSPRLGSINHTLLTLEALERRGIEVAMLVYNLYPPAPEEITEDTRRYLGRYLSAHHPEAQFVEVDTSFNVKYLESV